MKSLLLAAAGSGLLGMSVLAYSQTTDQMQQMQQTPPSMTQQTPPDQTQSDMSMGGMRMGTHDSGRSARTGAPCVTGLSCDIYQGN